MILKSLGSLWESMSHEHLLTSDSPEDSSANPPQLLLESGRDRDGLESRLNLLEAAVPANRIGNVCS